MQTFLPYADFQACAETLDNRRCGKQRIEALDLYRVLTQRKLGASEKQMAYIRHKYGAHPIVKMWAGFEACLLEYGRIMCLEWIKRGFRDTTLNKLMGEQEARPEPVIKPYWLGNPRLHASHRSNLLRKDKAFYGRFGWSEPDSLAYVWIYEGKEHEKCKACNRVKEVNHEVLCKTCVLKIKLEEEII